MSSNLVKLLFAVVISMVLGYLFKPMVNLMKPARPVAEETAPQPEAVTEDDETGSLTGTTRPTTPVVVHTTPLGDSVNVAELDDKDGLADDDDEGAWEEDGDVGDDWTVARDADSYTPKPAAVAPLKPVKEAEVPVEESEKKVPAALTNAIARSLQRKAGNLAEHYAKEDKKRKKDKGGYVSSTYKPEQWNRPELIYRELLEKTLPMLAQPEQALKALEDPETRLNLARMTLIRKVGYEKLAKVREMKQGNAMLSTPPPYCFPPQMLFLHPVLSTHIIP